MIFPYIIEIPSLKVFHLNSWKITIVWNITTLSQIVDNIIGVYISIAHSIALGMYEGV
jgi:hypothetical protein